MHTLGLTGIEAAAEYTIKLFKFAVIKRKKVKENSISVK